MEITNALLVALMFITVLSIGIASVLGSFATSIVRGARAEDSVQTSWRILILLAHFNLFWNTLDLFQVEDWDFLGFLFVILGPMLLFFATSVLIEAEPKSAESRESAPRLMRRFFVLLALVQLWILGTDLRLGHGIQGASYFNIATLVLALILAIATGPRARTGGTVVAWVIYLVGLVLRLAGAIR